MEKTVTRRIPKTIRVTTDSGSVYMINLEERLWWKEIMPREVYDLVSMQSGVRNNDPVSEWPKVEVPVVGLSMFIRGSGFSEWWLTTPVREVEEVR